MKAGPGLVSEPGTRLLVSVRSAAEADTALAGGADIIDVKEPRLGSLGMADAGTIAEVVATVGERTPVSVALGDMADGRAISPLPGVAWAKLGYRPAGRRWEQADWDYLIAEAQLQPTKLIPVFYADARRVRAVPYDLKFKALRHYRKVNARPDGILLDTAVKDGCGLLAWMTLPYLQEVCRSCHDAGLFLALAGSLSLEDVKLLTAEVRPDIIAVRGAACEQGSREGRVSAEAVAALKAVIRAGSPA